MRVYGRKTGSLQSRVEGMEIVKKKSVHAFGPASGDSEKCEWKKKSVMIAALRMM